MQRCIFIGCHRVFDDDLEPRELYDQGHVTEFFYEYADKEEPHE